MILAGDCNGGRSTLSKNGFESITNPDHSRFDEKAEARERQVQLRPRLRLRSAKQTRQVKYTCYLSVVLRSRFCRSSSYRSPPAKKSGKYLLEQKQEVSPQIVTVVCHIPIVTARGYSYLVNSVAARHVPSSHWQPVNRLSVCVF